MWSRAFHRRCTLCCKSLPETTGFSISSQGRKSRFLDRFLRATSCSQKAYHVSSVRFSKFTQLENTESDPPPESVTETSSIRLSPITGSERNTHAGVGADKGASDKTAAEAPDQTSTVTSDILDPGSVPIRRTLWLGIPNSDIIRESVFMLSEDIIDVELHRRVAGHSYAFLVFGSENIADINHRKLQNKGMDVEYLDSLKRTLWIQLGKSKMMGDLLQKIQPNCEDIKLSKLYDGTSHAYVRFTTEEAMLNNTTLFLDSLIETRTEQVYINDRLSKSQEMQHSSSEDPVQELSNLDVMGRTLYIKLGAAVRKQDLKEKLPEGVVIKFTRPDDGRKYAYITFPTSDLASKCKQYLDTFEQDFEETSLSGDSSLQLTISSGQNTTDKSLYLFLDVWPKQISQEDFHHLCPDFEEAHLINKATQRYAYLRFPSRESAEKNYETLKAEGHSIFTLEELRRFNYKESVVEKLKRVQQLKAIKEAEEQEKAGIKKEQQRMNKLIKKSHKAQQPNTSQENMKQEKTDRTKLEPQEKQETSENKEKYNPQCTLYLNNMTPTIRGKTLSKMSKSIRFIKVDWTKRLARSYFIVVSSPDDLEVTKDLLEKKGFDVNYSFKQGKEDNMRTIRVWDEKVSAEDLKSYSPKIVSVHIVTQTRKRYAKVMFHDQESAVANVDLFKKFAKVETHFKIG